MDLARFSALRVLKTDTPSVFISYSRDDEEKVQKLHEHLIEAGFNAWLDTKDLLGGEDWQRVIEEKIESSDLVLVCLSRSSIAKKGYLQKEVKRILEVAELQPEGAEFLIPVRLDLCEIPRSMSRFNSVDLFEGNNLAKLEESIRRAWRKSRLKQQEAQHAATNPKGIPGIRTGKISLT